MLVFPWILILVRNILINLSKNTEHNFTGLEALIYTLILISAFGNAHGLFQSALLNHSLAL